jgi:hypothetical protein
MGQADCGTPGPVTDLRAGVVKHKVGRRGGPQRTRAGRFKKKILALHGPDTPVPERSSQDTLTRARQVVRRAFVLNNGATTQRYQ